MPQKIRMWEVTPQDTLAEVTSSGINLERRLENWLESDISMLDPALLVIGRQVRTDFGGEIDLLCLDSDGSLVVVELKKGMSPREVTAQALDYASWVKDLSFDRIREIASGYSKLGGSLEDAFKSKFGEPLPSTLNEEHRSLIVAEAMDASTERIVHYLTGLNVPINVATVQHFKDSSGKELLAQVFLVEPEVAQIKVQAASKRSLYGTVNGINDLADSNGIGHLYGRVRAGVRGILNATAYSNSVGYYRRFDNGGSRTLLFVHAVPPDEGGMSFTAHATRFDNHMGINLDELRAILPDNSREITHVRTWVGSEPEERENAVGLEGTFHTVEEVDQFITRLQGAVHQNPVV